MLHSGRIFWVEEEGQGLPEYGLLIAVIVALVVAVSQLFGTQMMELLNAISGFIAM